MNGPHQQFPLQLCIAALRLTAAVLFSARVLLSNQAEAEILWRGDFENGTTEQWRGTATRNDGVSVVTDPVRAGKYALRIDGTNAARRGDRDRIELQHPDAADQLMVREVRAKMPAQETEHPERNDQLMKTLADRTSGKYYVGIDAAVKPAGGEPGVAAQLKAQDQSTPLPGTPDRKFEQLLMTWLMGLICGVLCLEWLLRRLSKLA